MKVKKIFIVAMLLISCILLYGSMDDNINKIDYIQILENPNTPVNNITADKLREKGARLDLTVRKIKSKKIEIAPEVERDDNGNVYLKFKLEKENDNTSYFVTDDRYSLPRNNTVNKKKVKFKFRWTENGDIDSIEKPKVLNFVVENKEEVDSSNNIKSIDIIKIKMTESLNGDKIYIAKINNSTDELEKLYYYKFFKGRAASSKMALPNVGKWRVIKLLGGNKENFPKPLNGTSELEPIENYKFYNNRYVYTGTIQSEKKTDRKVAYIVRLMNIEDVRSNPGKGQIIEVNGRWSNAGNKVYLNDREVNRATVYTEYLICNVNLGGTQNYKPFANATELADGNVAYPTVIQETSDDVLIRNVRRVVNISWLYATIFAKGWVFGTTDNSEWYRLVEITLPEIIKPGMYYMSSRSFNGFARLRTSRDWLWEDRVGSSQIPYYNQPNVDMYYEQPPEVMAFLVTRDALEKEVVLRGDTDLTDRKVSISKWLNRETKEDAGYQDFFHYIAHMNEAPFNIVKNSNGVDSLIYVNPGINRGEYNFHIRAGAVNNELNGIVSIKGKPLDIADTNSGIDKYKVWYINYSSDVTLSADFSEVLPGTLVGWSTETINGSGINTNIPQTYSTTKSNSTSNGIILTKQNGKIFDSLEWIEAEKLLINGIDRLEVTDNGVTIPQSDIYMDKTHYLGKKMIKIRDEKGEVVANIGVEGRNGLDKGHLGDFFIEKVRRDYKPHKIVIKAYDRKGYLFGTINLDLKIDKVNKVGYIGAQLSEIMLKSMKKEGKTHYAMGFLDNGNRKVAGIGSVGTQPIGIPDFSEVTLDMDKDFSTGNIHYEQQSRKYITGQGTEGVFNTLTSIKYKETLVGILEDRSFTSFPKDNKDYLGFNQFLANLAFDTSKIPVGNAGTVSKNNEIRFIVQAKVKNKTYPTYLDSDSGETIVDKGEFFEIGILPMIVPETTDGEIRIDTTSPTQYSYLSQDGVTVYTYILGNEIGNYQQDLGIEKRNSVISRGSVTYGVLPNGSLPMVKSSFGENRVIAQNMKVTTPKGVVQVSGTKYVDSNDRYEFVLTNMGIHSKLELKIKVPFKIDEQITIEPTYTLTGITNPITIGRTTLHIKSGELIKGETDLDLTRVRREDVLRWDKSFTSEIISAKVNGMDRTYSGVSLENIKGTIFIGNSKFGLDNYHKITVEYNGQIKNIDLNNKIVEFNEFDIGVGENNKFYFKKKVKYVADSKCIISLYDVSNKKYAETTLNIKDKIRENVLTDTYKVHNIYKFLTSGKTPKINFVGNNGELFDEDTKLIGTPLGTDSTQSVYVSKSRATSTNSATYPMDIIGIDGENSSGVYSKTGSVASEDKLWSYTNTGEKGPRIIVPIHLKSNFGGVNSSSLIPFYTSTNSFSAPVVSGKGKLYSRKDEIIEWRTKDNRLVSTTLEGSYEDYESQGNGVLDLHRIPKDTVLEWEVGAPQLQNDSIIFDTMGQPVVKIPNGEITTITPSFTMTGDMFPTMLKPSESFITISKNENIPNTLNIVRKENGVVKDTKNSVMESENNLIVTFNDIQIGVKNGVFYIKKLVDKLPDSTTFEIIGSNNNGTLGKFILEIQDKKITTNIGSVKLGVYDNLGDVIIKDTKNLKWVAGTKNVYQSNENTSIKEQFEPYIEFVDNVVYNEKEKLNIEKILSDNIELMKISNSSYGLNGIAQITLPLTSDILDKNSMKLEEIKIKIQNIPKSYKVMLKNRYDDEYIYDYLVESKGNILLSGAKGEVDLGNVNLNEKIKWDFENKNHIANETIKSTDGKVEMKFTGQAPYLKIEDINIPRRLNITVDNQNITGSDGNSKLVTTKTKNIEFGLENGVFTMTKLLPSLEDKEYIIDVIGKNNTSMGTFTIKVKGELPIEVNGKIDIDNRLISNKTSFVTDEIGLVNKTDFSKKIEAPKMIIYTPISQESISPVVEVIKLKKNNIDIPVQDNSVNNIKNYNNEIYIEDTTATTVDQLLKSIHYDIKGLVADKNDKITNYEIIYLGKDKKLYKLITEIKTKYVIEGSSGTVYLNGLATGKDYIFQLEDGKKGNNISSILNEVVLEGDNIAFVEDSFGNNIVLEKIDVKVNNGNTISCQGKEFNNGSYSITLENTEVLKNKIVINKIKDVYFNDKIEITGYYKEIPLGTFRLKLINIKSSSGEGTVNLSGLEKKKYNWLPFVNSGNQSMDTQNQIPIKWKNTLDDLPVTAIDGKTIVQKIKGTIEYRDIYGQMLSDEKMEFEKIIDAGRSTYIEDKSKEVVIGFDENGQFTLDYKQLLNTNSILIDMNVYDEKDYLLGNLKLTLQLEDIRQVNQLIYIDYRVAKQYGGKGNSIKNCKIVDSKGSELSEDLYSTIDQFINYTNKDIIPEDLKNTRLSMIKDKKSKDKISYFTMVRELLSNLSSDKKQQIFPDTLNGFGSMLDFGKSITINLDEFGTNLGITTLKDEAVYLNSDKGIIYNLTLTRKLLGEEYSSGGKVDIGGMNVGDYVEFSAKENIGIDKIVGVVKDKNGNAKATITGETIFLDVNDGNKTIRLPNITSYVNNTKNMLKSPLIYKGDGFDIELNSNVNIFHDYGDVIIKITKNKEVIDDTTVLLKPTTDIGLNNSVVLGELNLMLTSRSVVIDPDIGGKGILDFGQLLYDSNGDYHYGEVLVGVKGLVGEKKVRLEIQTPTIHLTNTVGDKVKVINMKTDLITPKSDVNGKAQFMISGEAEVLKTTKVGKYNGEVTVDVYIDL